MGGSEESLEIHWVKWYKVCLSHDQMGLGVPRVREFNYALFSKWGWRINTYQKGLWFKVVPKKYRFEDESRSNRTLIWWRYLKGVSGESVM